MTPILPPCHIPEQWASLLAHDLEGARESITLTALSAQPTEPHSLTPIAAVWRALTAAASRGVACRLILAAPQTAHPATAINRSAARWAEHRKIACYLVPGPSLLHAKTCTIDDRLAWIGSGNLTIAASATNKECWARIDSGIIAARLAAKHADWLGEAPPAPPDHAA